MASASFIDAALERAHANHFSFFGFVSQESHAHKEFADDKQQSQTLFLMSHVTANISSTVILIPFIHSQTVTFNCLTEVFHTQNFPDSAFKPPKASA